MATMVPFKVDPTKIEAKSAVTTTAERDTACIRSKAKRHARRTEERAVNAAVKNAHKVAVRIAKVKVKGEPAPQLPLPSPKKPAAPVPTVTVWFDKTQFLPDNQVKLTRFRSKGKNIELTLPRSALTAKGCICAQLDPGEDRLRGYVVLPAGLVSAVLAAEFGIPRDSGPTKE